MSDITALAKTLRLAAESEIAHRAESDTSDLWQDEASPENILALVEALEKVQQYAKARDEENQSLMLTVGRLRVERESLESRTVTVKLLPRVDSSKLPFTAHTWNCCLDAVEKCLTAAGIQVIEGEA